MGTRIEQWAEGEPLRIGVEPVSSLICNCEVSQPYTLGEAAKCH